MTAKAENILFVCTGNICRSPFAEGLFNVLIEKKGLQNLAARSAGLFALPGNQATYMAQQVAAEYNVNLAEHQARLVTAELAARSDLILVMEKHHWNSIVTHFPETSDRIRLLRHFARYGSRKRGIADPYGLDYEAYRFCFLDIEDAVSGLIEFLSKAAMDGHPKEKREKKSRK
jgi:protein arginine phosphatase